MDIIKGSVKQPITVTVAVFFVLVAGFVSLKVMPIQMTPEVEDTIIAVTTTWENASPQEIESEVIDPQEEKLQSIANLRGISSLSSRGTGVVRLEFNTGVDKEVALREVSDKLREVERYPENVDEPVIEASDPESSDFIAWYVLTTDDPSFDIRKFYDRAKDKIEPILERIPGISEVNVLGGYEREVQIQFDAKKMAQHKITVQELYNTIRAANINFSGGALEQGKSDVRVRAVGRFSSVDQVKDYVIKNESGGAVYLRDIAEVVETYKEATSFVRVRGQHSLAFNFQKEPGGNVLKIMKALADTVESFQVKGGLFETEARQLGLKGKMAMRISYDSTLYINQALALVKDNLYVGGILAIIILLLFLRSFRSAGIIALAIPVSMVGTIVFMLLLGRSINVISLAGMAFAVGMVVDNSIVVLENIYRHIEQGKKGYDAAYIGTKEVAGAVFASTLTTIVVFFPILFIEDQVGQLFRDIAITIMVSIFLSYVVSITVIPSAAAIFMKAGKNIKAKSSKQPLLYRVIYYLNGNLVLRLFTVAFFSIFTIVGIIMLIPPLDYLPAGNRNITFGVMITPPGYSINKMEELGLRLEETVRPFWEGKEDRPKFKDPYTGEIVQPAPIEEYFVVVTRGILFHGAISANAKQAVDSVALFNGATSQEKMPGVYGFAFQFPLFRLGGSSGSAVKMNLTGNNLEEVSRAAGAIFGMVMQSGSGTIKPDPANFSVNAPELQVFPNSLRLAENKLTHTDLGIAMAANSDGLYAGEYDLSGDLVDLKVINKESKENLHINDLASTFLATPQGKVISLGEVGQFSFVDAPEQIKRVGRERAVTLEFTAPKGMPLESAVALLQEKISGLRAAGAIPPGVNVQLEGTAGKLKDIKTKLMGDGSVASTLQSSLFLAGLTVYLLMCILFQSWVQPFIIMFTVPLATFGGFVGLALVHYISKMDRYMPVQNLDVLTILGFIILAGVVVNNAILIVAQANNLLRGVDDFGNPVTPLPPREAVAEAVQSRVRPIFMSLLTSLGGMLPLVLTPGSGSELYRGLGAVILGGMLFSTLFTLILVPILMGLVYDFTAKFSTKKILTANVLITFFITIFLVGCAAGKKVPETKEIVKVPENWQQSGLPKNGTNIDKWWEHFQDEKLLALIKKARENNPDIAIGYQKFLMATTLIERENAGFLPSRTLNASASRNRLSNNLKNSFQSTDAFNDLRLGMNTRWEIDLFGRIRDAVSAAEKGAKSRQEDVAALHVIISAEVAKNYYKYLSYKKQEEIIQENLKLREENLQLISAQREAGEATELEINEAKIILAQGKKQLEQIKQMVNLQENILNLLVGEMPGAIENKNLPNGDIPEINNMLEIGLPADLVRRRPDIRSAEYAIAAAASELRIAEKEYLPKFILNDSVGLHATYPKNFLNRDSRTYSFGPSFEWRIFDSGKIASDISWQEARLQETVEIYRKTVLNAFKEVEDSLVQLRYLKEQEKHIDTLLMASSNSSKLAKILYDEGLRDYQTVISALIIKQDAEMEVIINRENSMLSLINLYKSLGGGK